MIFKMLLNIFSAGSLIAVADSRGIPYLSVTVDWKPECPD
jgi:hypothetical protein